MLLCPRVLWVTWAQLGAGLGCLLPLQLSEVWTGPDGQGGSSHGCHLGAQLGLSTCAPPCGGSMWPDLPSVWPSVLRGGSVSEKEYSKGPSGNFKASYALATEVIQHHFSYIPLVKLSRRPTQMQRRWKEIPLLPGRSCKEFAFIFDPPPVKTENILWILKRGQMRDPFPPFPLQILPILTTQGSCDLIPEPSIMAPGVISFLAFLLPHLPKLPRLCIFVCPCLTELLSYVTAFGDLMDLASYVVNSCWKAGILPCPS